LTEDLQEYCLAPVFLLQKAINYLRLPSGDPSIAISNTSSIISLSTDKFYAWPYKDVPSHWRRIYVDASIVQSIALIYKQQYVFAVETLDKALIMAGGQGHDQEIQSLFNYMSKCLIIPGGAVLPDTFPIVIPKMELTHPIPRTDAPSFSQIQQHIATNRTPFIITNALNHWSVLQTWQNPNYFMHESLMGTRLIPIELGESYVSETWSQKLIPFSTFLSTHLLRSSREKGYLAQHDLLRQMPNLRKGISIPEYCFADPAGDDKEEVMEDAGDNQVMENIWMGPAGTKSPLHHDPYHNIFAQVVGYKYFRLYAPEMKSKLYPRGIEGGIDMGNTSMVDVDNPDLKVFPKFAEAEYVEGVLGPGECLYIPVHLFCSI